MTCLTGELGRMMKHVFVLNPAAGQGNAIHDYKNQIMDCARSLNCDFDVYITQGVADAKNFVAAYDQLDEYCRYYACGGDGTLHEVINGAFGKPHCEVAVIPSGTGNDFIRNFTNSKNFSDIERQIQGESILIDLIRYNHGYAVNMVNIGYDCRVVARSAKLKQYPLISGTMAYISGVAIELFKKFGDQMELIFDNGQMLSDQYLLCSVANGAFCGGGFCSSSEASVTDGFLDVNVIKKMSRGRFLSLLGDYKKGNLYYSNKSQGVFDYIRCREVRIRQKSKSLFCIDGEIYSQDELTFSVEPQAIRFCIPYGSFLLSEASASDPVKLENSKQRVTVE